MTSNIKVLPGRGTRTFLIAFATSSIVLFMIAALALFVLAPSVVFAARSAEPVSQPVSYAVVKIAKPTYTPSPTPSPTPTMPPPTATLEPTATAQAVDTSIQIDPVNGAPAPQAPVDTSSGKYILVSISQQHLWAYDNGQEVYSFVASTGIHNGTRTGTFSVLDKIPSAYGATWNIWMPSWMGIYYAGTLENGIHALPILPNGATLWEGFLGTPISYGCVVLGTYEAQELYNWADVGTPVEIRY